MAAFMSPGSAEAVQGTPSTPDAIPSEQEDSAQLLRDEAESPVSPAKIAARSESLRMALAIDMEAIPNALLREELEVLTAAFGPPTEDRDILASWLMRGGLVTATGEGLSGIYNPLADAWLLMGWRKIGGSARLVWAALTKGHMLRPANQPDWVESGGPLDDELFRVSRQSLSSLASVPDELGTDGLVELVERFRGAEGGMVLDRARAMAGALAGWASANTNLLKHVNAEALSCSCRALRALPMRTRETLSPLAVLSGPEGEVLVLQSALEPKTMVLASIQKEKRKRPDFLALNLAANQVGRDEQ
ncbi:MAG: hypothetical protein N2423_07400 [Novosphingobium sp.]|nr:hypothetical protein [Novosphingobium sp.]